MKILHRTEKRAKNHVIAIPTLRSEKLFVQENKLQMKTEVVRNSVCEQSEIFLHKCFSFCIIWWDNIAEEKLVASNHGSYQICSHQVIGLWKKQCECYNRLVCILPLDTNAPWFHFIKFTRDLKHHVSNMSNIGNTEIYILFISKEYLVKSLF